MSREVAVADLILDKPQLADNIGAVARVMANFGLSELRLVSPRDGWPQERAWATASGVQSRTRAASASQPLVWAAL